MFDVDVERGAGGGGVCCCCWREDRGREGWGTLLTLVWLSLALSQALTMLDITRRRKHARKIKS